MLQTVRYLLIIVVCALSSSCEKFETNPYKSSAPLTVPRELNALNIGQLTSSVASDDTVTIVVTGDSQRFYDKSDDLVNKINGLSSVDFLIIAGDITDFGTAQEFGWIYDKLSQLNVPYFCAVGNHDLVANGSELFSQVFGPKNFSFQYKNCKFIFHGTNSREYGFNGHVPDISFLKNEMNDTLPETFIGVSHVPPFNEDFDKSLEELYCGQLRSDPRFKLSIHGHLHGSVYGRKYGDHVNYLVAPEVGQGEVYLLKIHDGQINRQLITF